VPIPPTLPSLRDFCRRRTLLRNPRVGPEAAGGRLLFGTVDR